MQDFYWKGYQSIDADFFKCLVSRILQACDRLRDDNLPELGVKLEDVEGTKFCFFLLPWNILSVPCTFFCFAPLGGHAPVIKFVDRETLLKEKQQQLEVDSFGYVFVQDYAITFCFQS